MKIINKFFATAFLIFPTFFSIAQTPGTSCLGAVSVPANGTSTVFTQSSPAGWLSFVANETDKVIQIINAGGANSFKIKKVIIARGACSSITSIVTDTMTAGNDSLLEVTVTGMTIGDTYFIRTMMQNSVDCPNCSSPGSAYFKTNLQILAPLYCGLQYYNGAASNCIGDYNAGTPSNPNPPHLCYATTCVGTPVSFAAGNGTGIPGTAYYYLTVTGPPNFTTSPVLANGLFNSTITFTQPGTYTVSQTIMNGNTPSSGDFVCPNGWVITVINPPSPVFTINPTPACSGSPICFTGSANPAIYDTYEWTIYDVTNLNVPVIHVFGQTFCTSSLAPGNYTVYYNVYSSLSANNPWGIPPGCNASASQNFTVYPGVGTVIANANPMTTVCADDPVNLTASSTSPATYVWMPGNLPGSNVIVTPSATTTYTVTATNPAGCTSTQTVTVTVNNCCINPNSLTYQIILKNVTIVPIGTPGAIPWTNLAFGNTYIGVSIQLPPAGMPQGVYTIRGTLTINVPSTTTTFYGSDIIFDDCASINQLTPLSFDKSWLHACNMWQGIVSKGYIKITNSIIEDAQAGISVFSVNAHPGIFVDNTVFNKNQYGILLAAATQFNTSSPNNFRITGSIFTCKNLPPGTYTFPLGSGLVSSLIGVNNTVKGGFSTMKGVSSSCLVISPDRSEAGVLIAISSVNTGIFFNIGNSTSKNYFSYLNTGIYNTGSKIYVVNCNFQQIINSGVNIAKGGIFHDGGTGNTITNVGDLNSTAKACKFQVSNIGINAIRGGIMNISNNNFNLATNSSIAIKVQNWNSPLFNNSPTGTVDVINNNFTSSSNVDFYAFDNSSIKVTMQGNTSNGPGLFNVNIQELGPRPNALYRVDGNVFSDKNSGIYLNTVNNANITDNTIKIAQNTTTSTYTSAIWNNNSANCLFSNNALNSVGGNTNNASYQVLGILNGSAAGNIFCSNDIKKLGTLMKFQGACNPSHVFSNSLNATGPAALFGILLDGGGSMGNLGVNSGGNWYASENVFGNFVPWGGQIGIWGGSNCPVSSATVYYNGPPPNQNALPGSCLFSYSSVASIPGGPLCPSATFRTAGDTSEMRYYPMVKGEIPYISLKQMYYLAKMYEQYRFILPQTILNECASSNIGKFYNADSLTNDYSTTHNIASLSAAKNLNSSIIPVNNIENNQKEFNTICYTYLSQDSLGMIGYLNDLKILAAKCPMEEGNSVYQSRALLSHYDTAFYFNPCEFLRPEGAGNDPGSVNADETALQLYPNPATGEVFIRTGLDAGKVEIYNLLGVKVAGSVISQGENKLDVSTLSSGTYFFKIYTDQSIISVSKVVISNQ